MSVRCAPAVALSTLLALTACQDDGRSSADDPASPPAASSSATAVASADDRDHDPTTIEVTAPGAELELSEKAVLPLSTGGGIALAEVTVRDITQGTDADLKAAKVLDGDAHSLFYINVEMKILSTGDEPFSYYAPISNFHGLIDGFLASGLIAVGPASPCNIDGTFGYDAKAGDTATGCVPVLAPRGREIEGVEYSLEGDAGYDRLHGEAVTWR